MLDIFNNTWVFLIAGFILFIIIRKIYNFNQPFDETKFIEQFKNQQKLKKKFTFDNIHKGLPTIASYYVGII